MIHFSINNRNKNNPMAPPIKKDNATESESSSGPGKTLVILAKNPDKNKASPSVSVLSSPSIQTEILKSPVIIQKPPAALSEQPEESSVQLLGSVPKEEYADLVKNFAQRVQVQQKPSTTQSEASGDQKHPAPEITHPVKLIDESLQWCDNALDFLHDSSDFYVVGVLGTQGVGKSTIMSIISGIHSEKSKWQCFKPQTAEYKEMGEYCTTGIDMFITKERIILLDCQPVMSPSVMDRMILYEKKPQGGPDYHSVENSLLMQSLQQAAFLMAVCHTIISVQDWFIDLNYLKFLLSAEMLKPVSHPIHDPNPIPEETSDCYPHIVFVQNHCQREDFYPDNVQMMQDTLNLAMQKSKLKYTGSVVYDAFRHCEKDSSKEVNLFLIPEKESPDFDGPSDLFPDYRGHPGYFQLAESFTQQVLSMPRSPLYHSALSEKNWFHYSARLWETVKKSNLFLEYSRLLP